MRSNDAIIAPRTLSEIVVPYFSREGDLLGVLNVDSNESAAFTSADQEGLEGLVEIFHSWTRCQDGSVIHRSS